MGEGALAVTFDELHVYFRRAVYFETLVMMMIMMILHGISFGIKNLQVQNLYTTELQY